jgi:hypothetical protein
MVKEIVAGSTVTYAKGGGPDPRCYKVDCSKIAAVLPEFQPQWTVWRGVEQLYEAFRRYRLTEAEFLGSKYLRIKRIRELQSEGRLDGSLRWLKLVNSSSLGPRTETGLSRKEPSTVS